MRTFARLFKHRPLLINAGIVLTAAVTVSFGQSQVRKNNPYAPSPAGNSSKVSNQAPRADQNGQIASVRNERQVSAANTQMVKYDLSDTSIGTPKPVSVAPTDTYRIGVNDVLHIRLGNAAAVSAHYAVRSDGTIDFPLAGDDVNVSGLTVSDVVKKLKRSIKLFSEPRVEVAVSEYASHAVTVSGKVKNPGEKYLRREAVPLFVIKAEAMIDPQANAVRITREGSDAQTYRLHDAQTDSLLILPGMKLEFRMEELRQPELYFIAGSQMKTTERRLSLGLTISNVAASEAADAKKATIHRKDKNGKFTSRDIDLRAIKAGKAVDSTIEAGDIIKFQN